MALKHEPDRGLTSVSASGVRFPSKAHWRAHVAIRCVTCLLIQTVATVFAAMKRLRAGPAMLFRPEAPGNIGPEMCGCGSIEQQFAKLLPRLPCANPSAPLVAVSTQCVNGAHQTSRHTQRPALRMPVREAHEKRSPSDRLKRNLSQAFPANAY